jgi:hypothetical protein
MPTSNRSLPVSRKALWIGYLVSALPVLLLVFSAVIKLMKPPQMVEGFARLGIPDSLISQLGILELVCVILYLVPRTSNLRLGESFLLPLMAGMMIWGGLYLRDQRVRALIPLRRQPD